MRYFLPSLLTWLWLHFFRVYALSIHPPITIFARYYTYLTAPCLFIRFYIVTPIIRYRFASILAFPAFVFFFRGFPPLHAYRRIRRGGWGFAGPPFISSQSCYGSVWMRVATIKKKTLYSFFSSFFIYA